MKHLPPTHWQLSSGFQAEFEEKIMRREINYPINKNISFFFFFCNVTENAKHRFIFKHFKEIYLEGLGANDTVEAKHENMQKMNPVLFGNKKDQFSHSFHLE